MDPQQLMLVQGVILAVLLVLALVLFWLARQLSALQQSYTALNKQLARNAADLAGLCSAAIAVDRRLADNEAQFSRLQQVPIPQPISPTQLADKEPQLEGYAKAIQMIIRGASVEELVKSCGMTRDEAMLLISVNRSKDLSG